MKSKLLTKSGTALAASALFLAAAAAQGPDPDPGNLTITVQENENGSITFSASGTATTFFGGPLFFTPTDSTPGNPRPPHTLTSPPVSNPPLPPGLFLSFPQSFGSEPETAGSPEEVPLEIVQYPLNFVMYFESGNWALSDESSFLSEEESPVLEGSKLYYVDGGETITGSGSVTVSGIPFSNFVPGTFTIRPTERRDRDPNLFQITYKVIPWQGSPRLSLENAATFPDTRVGRPSRLQTLKLKNTGTAQVTGIRTALDRDATDFRVRIPAVRALDPGKTLIVQVRFRPTAEGPRRSTLSIKSNAPDVSTGLSGEGIRTTVTPRFPRGIYR
jgi:hypothetical protein